MVGKLHITLFVGVDDHTAPQKKHLIALLLMLSIVSQGADPSRHLEVGQPPYKNIMLSLKIRCACIHNLKNCWVVAF